MWRRVGMVFVVLMAGLTAGCFDYEEELVLNKDGSGRISFHYAIEKEYLRQMEELTKSMQAMMGADTSEVESPFAEWSEESIREVLAEGEGGVELVSYQAGEDEAVQTWDMKFAFEDVNRMGEVWMALYPDDGDEFEDEEYAVEEEAAGEEELMLLFTQQDDGTWLFRRPLDMDDEMGEEPDEYGYDDAGEYEDADVYGDAEEHGEVDEYGEPGGETEGESAADSFAQDLEAGMKEMFAGHRIRFAVTFPGKVIESNATSVEGNTAVWEFAVEEVPELEELRAVVAD